MAAPTDAGVTVLCTREDNLVAIVRRDNDRETCLLWPCDMPVGLGTFERVAYMMNLRKLYPRCDVVVRSTFNIIGGARPPIIEWLERAPPGASYAELCPA